MDIKELKSRIESKSLDDSFLIFQYSDNTFLARQYIQAIASFKNLTINYVEAVEDVPVLVPGQLNVCFLEEYTDMMYWDYLVNLIVVCKKVGIGGHSSTIVFPKLEDWQIEEYLQVQLPGVESSFISWLCQNAHYDIERLDLEARKINIFPKGKQQQIFQQLNEAHNYADLNTLGIYDLVNAALRKDTEVLKLYYTEELKVDSLGLVSLLIRNFKQVLDIQLNPKATAESLGISFKQFKAIQNNCGFYTNEQLMHVYRFLLGIDYRVKTGQLEYAALKDYTIPTLLLL